MYLPRISARAQRIMKSAVIRRLRADGFDMDSLLLLYALVLLTGSNILKTLSSMSLSASVVVFC